MIKKTGRARKALEKSPKAGKPSDGQLTDAELSKAAGGAADYYLPIHTEKGG